MGAYGFYERRVFPHLMDRAMKPFRRYRRPTLEGVSGNVLEIGFGTGLNLAFYPEGVDRLTAVDPMDNLPAVVARRIADALFEVDRRPLAADGGLPFEDASFDTVVVTWTLCTIPDPVAALREMRRVARPGSALHFVEHGRSDDAAVQTWQDRLNGFQRFVGCGCNLNRPMDELIQSGGFRIEELERFDVRGVPRTHGHLYQGVARA